MAYTLSMDASLKAKKENLKGIINHHFRDVLEQNGIHLQHKNDNIDPTRTSQNMSIYYNQTEETFLPCTDTNQILESLNTRFSTVKKPLRADAVLCRNLVLQLDPEFYKTATAKEQEDSYFAMLNWATKTFSKQNLIGISCHLDETNPHIHVLFTPVTQDGRLSQKDWFPNPASLRDMHKDFRTHMANKGYNISFNKQPPRKHLSDTDFKILKQSEEKIEDIKKKEKELEQLQAQETALNIRIQSLQDREQSLDYKATCLAGVQDTATEYYNRAKLIYNSLNANSEEFRKNQAKQYGNSLQNINNLGAQLDESLLPHTKQKDRGLSL